MKKDIEQKETIVALSTPPGYGGIGVIRISGENALSIAGKIFCSPKSRKLSDYRLHYGNIVDPESGEAVDEVMLAVMRSPHSYTREDVVEVQAHGGPAVLRDIIGLVLKQGARLAEPGEFTRRAFLNGRIDLVQAEAVLALIQTGSSSGRRLAGSQVSGKISSRIEKIRDSILSLMSRMEATVEFPEEETGPQRGGETIEKLLEIRKDMEKLLEGAGTGRVLREGATLVIAGRPNVGKSSILNRLLGEERAIVSPIPGTTRDLLEEGFNIRGMPVKLVDTAGLSDGGDLLESMGVERAYKRLEEADLIMLVLDGSEELTLRDREIIDRIGERPFLTVVNKADLPLKLNSGDVIPGEGGPPVMVSALTCEGMDDLVERLYSALFGKLEGTEESAWMAGLRQEESLRDALERLGSAVESAEKELSEEFILFDLRGALEGIEEVTGKHFYPEMLDRIFSEFCIGK